MATPVPVGPTAYLTSSFRTGGVPLGASSGWGGVVTTGDATIEQVLPSTSTRAQLTAPGTAFASAYWQGYADANLGNLGLWLADQEAAVELAVIPADTKAAGVCCRITSPGATPTFYRLVMTNSAGVWNYRAEKVIAGAAPVTIVSGATAIVPADGDAIMLRCRGTTLTGHVRSNNVWTVMFTATDASIAGQGHTGIHGNDAAVRFTHWQTGCYDVPDQDLGYIPWGPTSAPLDRFDRANETPLQNPPWRRNYQQASDALLADKGIAASSNFDRWEVQYDSLTLPESCEAWMVLGPGAYNQNLEFVLRLGMKPGATGISDPAGRSDTPNISCSSEAGRPGAKVRVYVATSDGGYDAGLVGPWDGSGSAAGGYFHQPVGGSASNPSNTWQPGDMLWMFVHEGEIEVWLRPAFNLRWWLLTRAQVGYYRRPDPYEVHVVPISLSGGCPSFGMSENGNRAACVVAVGAGAFVPLGKRIFAIENTAKWRPLLVETTLSETTEGSNPVAAYHEARRR